MTTAARPPIRIFLDSGIIIEGCYSTWGASKGVLILATVQPNITIVLAKAVLVEVLTAIAIKSAGNTETLLPLLANFLGWLKRVRAEEHANPTEDELAAYAPVVLPALRHVNDLPPVVTAIKAKPDWVLSTNTAHWNQPLALRTGLRIATPSAFLQQLVPPTGH